MNRTLILEPEVETDFRNLEKGGFGMATTKVHPLSIKLDDELNNQFENYLKIYQADKSKVTRTALKEFLDKRMSMSPMSVKKEKTKTT